MPGAGASGVRWQRRHGGPARGPGAKGGSLPRAPAVPVLEDGVVLLPSTWSRHSPCGRVRAPHSRPVGPRRPSRQGDAPGAGARSTAGVQLRHSGWPRDHRCRSHEASRHDEQRRPGPAGPGLRRSSWRDVVPRPTRVTQLSAGCQTCTPLPARHPGVRVCADRLVASEVLGLGRTGHGVTRCSGGGQPFLEHRHRRGHAEANRPLRLPRAGARDLHDVAATGCRRRRHTAPTRACGTPIAG